MGDEELMERWCGGYLTELAVEVARKEFAQRGIQPPDYVPKEVDSRPADRGEPSDLIEVARSQAFGELEVLAARLESEGIPPLIVNANSNRMGPPFSNSAGGSRLLVPSPFAKDAKEIVALLKSGAFILRDGDDLR